MLLSEHVYYVTITFKMSEWAEQQICIKFCVKLELSSMETIGMIQRPQLLAAGEWQLHHDNVPAHASRLMQSFLAKHPIAQVTQPHYSPDLVPCDFWLFPKLKSPFQKGKRFQTVDEIQENMMGQLMVTGRSVWGPKGAYFEGDWDTIVLCMMLLVSCVFCNKCLYFSYYMAGYFLDRPRFFTVGYGKRVWKTPI